MNIFLFQVTYLSELEYSTQNKQDKICMRTNNKQIYVLITSSYFVFNFYIEIKRTSIWWCLWMFHIKHPLNGLYTIVIQIKDKTKLKINCHHLMLQLEWCHNTGPFLFCLSWFYIIKSVQYLLHLKQFKIAFKIAK